MLELLNIICTWVMLIRRRCLTCSKWNDLSMECEVFATDLPSPPLPTHTKCNARQRCKAKGGEDLFLLRNLEAYNAMSRTIEN